MNTEDKNKLIAEFMGLTVIQSPIKDENGEFHWHFNGSNNFPLKTAVQSNLKYNYDWNDLIKVVEKIENYNDSSTLFIIEDERCHVNSQNGFEVDSVGHTKIEAVYNACVEFIQWFDQQKSS